MADPSGLFPCAGVENDADCDFLRRAIESAQSGVGVTAIRDAAFGTPGSVNETCPTDDDSSLDALVQALVENYPVAGITNFEGSPLIPARHRAILIRLAEAVIVMDRKLNSIGKSLNGSMSNGLNISFDYVIGNDSGQGYVNLYNSSTFPMQLGNNTVTDAVVHEWGHAFDREASLAHSGYLNTVETGGNFHAVHSALKPPRNPNAGCDQMVLYSVPREDGYEVYDYPYYVLSGVSPEAPADYQRCHIGYGYEANATPDAIEDWADMYMNWIYKTQYRNTLQNDQS